MYKQTDRQQTQSCRDHPTECRMVHVENEASIAGSTHMSEKPSNQNMQFMLVGNQGAESSCRIRGHLFLNHQICSVEEVYSGAIQPRRFAWSFLIMFCQGTKFTKRESIELPFLFCSQPHHFTEYAYDAYSCDDHSRDQQTYDGQEGLPESP